MGNISSSANVTVRNPLCDMTNVASRSAGPDNFIDLDRDVSPVGKENAIVPDSVSPSPFRHRSRLFVSKVCYYYVSVHSYHLFRFL